MLSNSIARYREIVHERKIRSKRQTLLLSLRKCCPSLSATTTLLSQQPSTLRQDPLLHQQKDQSLLEDKIGQHFFFFQQCSVYKLRNVHFQIQCYCTLNRLQKSVNITQGTGKPKNSRDSLYCDIRFLAMVWNQTHSIFEVCLYLKHMGFLFEVMKVFWNQIALMVAKPSEYNKTRVNFTVCELYLNRKEKK